MKNHEFTYQNPVIRGFCRIPVSVLPTNSIIWFAAVSNISLEFRFMKAKI